MLASTRLYHVVALLFVEVRLKMRVEERAFDVAEFLLVRQDEALQTVRTEVVQCVCVLLFVSPDDFIKHI